MNAALLAAVGPSRQRPRAKVTDIQILEAVGPSPPRPRAKVTDIQIRCDCKLAWAPRFTSLQSGRRGGTIFGGRTGARTGGRADGCADIGCGAAPRGTHMAASGHAPAPTPPPTPAPFIPGPIPGLPQPKGLHKQPAKGTSSSSSVSRAPEVLSMKGPACADMSKGVIENAYARPPHLDDMVRLGK